MRYAITGATGLLGRNLLFEIIKQNRNNLKSLKIFILGRNKNNLSLQKRLREIIIDDGCDYIEIRKDDLDKIDEIESVIIPINFDLSVDNLKISNEDFALLNQEPIDNFFHLAAATDFRATPQIQTLLENININGTKRILALVNQLKVREIIYSGSAYSCGNAQGLVMPDHSRIENEFRNPYEKTKLLGEIYFEEFAKTHKYKYKIFRPIGICGRLIEKPLGKIHKFDIFYGWATYFLREKLKYCKTLENIYNNPLNLPIRIRINLNSGLNTVPADYSAKIIYAACKHDIPGNHFHLVNDVDMPHKTYIKLILDSLNIEGYNFIENEPRDKNKAELSYYRTVGKIFTPYVTFDSIQFYTDNLTELKNKTGIRCPKMDIVNFSILIDYAKTQYFGLFKFKTKNRVD